MLVTNKLWKEVVMKNKKNIIILVILISIFLLICVSIVLINNKTFFKNTYIGIQGQEIFIPKYSYFKEECCMTVAIFYSLRTEQELKKEINDYMSDFEYFTDNTTYGYKKGDLFIQTYEVVNRGLYRKIFITY